MLFCLTRRHYKTCSLNPNIWSLFMPRIDVVFAAVGCILPSFDITRRSNVSTLVCCSVGSSWSKERTTTGIATEEKDDSDGDVIPGIHETWWSSISLNFSFPCNGPSPFRRMWRGGKKDGYQRRIYETCRPLEPCYPPFDVINWRMFLYFILF